MRGCWLPLVDPSQVPAAEANEIVDLAREEWGVSRAQAQAALKLTDGFLSKGEVTINGVKVRPGEGASIVYHRQLDGLVSAKAELTVGGMPLEVPRAFRINTSALENTVPLGRFKRAAIKGARTVLGYFGIEGDIDVKLVRGQGLDAHAIVTLHLRLPAWLGGGQEEVKLKVNRDGQVDLESLSIGPKDLSVGGVGFKGLKLAFSNDVWRGEAELCITTEICIQARPEKDVAPPGGIEVGPDYFRVFANVTFPGDGLELFSQVFLTRIGAGLAEPPLRLLGAAQIKAARIYKADGLIAVAFPSAAAPFRLNRAEVGNNFRPEHYTKAFERFTIAAGADGFLTIPVIEKDIRLGGGHFLFHAPGYISFGGGLDAEFFDVIKIKGTTDGEFNLETGRFNLHGEVESCIADIPLLGDLCWGSTAHVSSAGAGGCIELALVSVGGGVRFSPFEIFLWPLDGCKWSVYREENVAGLKAAQAGGRYTVRTEAGDASRAVELRGADGAPRVRVTTADGKTVESSAGPGFTTADGVRIMRSERLKLTVVGLVKPAAGEHAIELLSDSPALAGVREAEDQPAARAKGKVSGRGSRRTFTYDVLRRADQRVRFFEVGPDGSREIGSTAGGRAASGSHRRPAAARGASRPTSSSPDSRPSA